MSHVLFTGGGTAGHVVPVFPLIQRLAERGMQVSFVGSNSGLEAGLLIDQPVVYYGIAAGKLRRYFSLENLLDVFRVLGGVFQAYRLLGRLRPDVVFSKGGFVSFPVVLAAWLRRVPVVAHESDLTPGLANKLAMPFVRTLCLNFPVTPTAGFRGKVLYTGTPMRPALLRGDATRGREFLGAQPDDRVLLVTGGSLGADVLNVTLRNSLAELTKQFLVVHVCGPGKSIAHDGARYRQYEYLTEAWGDVLAAADLVVSRAGANTLYELLALGKPNLLVPLALRASRGDQLENATYASGLGYSHVLDEETLSVQALVAAVKALDAVLPQVRERLESFVMLDATALICAELDAHLTET